MRKPETKTLAKGQQGLEVKRKELKYFVSYLDFVAMCNALDKVMQRDGHDKGKGYLIRSLYFDTLYDKDFDEKMAGFEKRKKIRLRIYGFDDKMAKLEMKSKRHDCIAKESLWIKRKDAIGLANGNSGVLLGYDNRIARKIYAEFKKFTYKPVVLIDYERSAFVYDFNNVRVTFDRRIRANSIDLNIFDREIFMKPLLSKKLVVLEIKFDHFMPDWLKTIVNMRSCNSAISKYCIGRLENSICYV